MGIFLLGALGLAIDGSHLYAHRQMAQAAADAAAQAGIMSIFDGTNGAGAHAFATGSTITCASSDPKTPCYYAQTLNGFNGANDVVTVDFPTAADVGVSLSSLSASDPVN
jgi:Flp pilus assembly protein TadG